MDKSPLHKTLSGFHWQVRAMSVQGILNALSPFLNQDGGVASEESCVKFCKYVRSSNVTNCGTMTLIPSFY